MNTSTLSYDESFTLILNLLEKAEQILSIINLSDSAVPKYNQLKQLTFLLFQMDVKGNEKDNQPR